MRPDDNRVTRFAALESWVHQLVSQCGKDVLGWNPTTLGAHCIYRRSALLETGGFTPGAFSEDIEVSLSLVGAGWRTRFVRDAIAGSEVPVSLAQFWNQRSRWTRGLYASGRKASGVETILVASGYLDRLVFLAVCIMASCGALSPLWPLLHLSGPSITVFAALCHAKVGQRTTSYLASAIQMFVLDIAVTASATVSAVLRRPLSWRGSSANGPR
jgi:cellulose synthase/poly-beta-1,6-N-acetylglucosamine synthase-like glycosyltransferase